MQQFWQWAVGSRGFLGQSPLEWTAAAASLLCVWLTVRNSIWNWFWGFIGVVLYGIIFWNYRNYANAGLQILYYVPIQFIGWYIWKRNGPQQDNDLPITQLSNRARVGALAITAALTALFYASFKYWLPALFPTLEPDPLPFGDGITTAMSIVAQYLQVHKRFENWWLWIAADIIYAVYVFPQGKLYVSAWLYVIFTILAIVGAISWRKILLAQEAAKSTLPVAEPIRPYA
ncbi:MAG: nicotinamide mononucleotide transporter [Cytophagales bacterium]|nr:nicotinamide mononucleotide transporter [Armatimonadota bacterium]